MIVLRIGRANLIQKMRIPVALSNFGPEAVTQLQRYAFSRNPRYAEQCLKLIGPLLHSGCHIPDIIRVHK